MKESEYEYPRGCDSAKVLLVIETKSARGMGTNMQPSRMVTEYWSLSGEKLAEVDPYEEGDSMDQRETGG